MEKVQKLYFSVVSGDSYSGILFSVQAVQCHKKENILSFYTGVKTTDIASESYK
jgi:hypothetical protein